MEKPNFEKKAEKYSPLDALFEEMLPLDQSKTIKEKEKQQNRWNTWILQYTEIVSGARTWLTR